MEVVYQRRTTKQPEKEMWKVKENGKGLGDGSGESALKEDSVAATDVMKPGDQENSDKRGRLVNTMLKEPEPARKLVGASDSHGSGLTRSKKVR